MSTPHGRTSTSRLIPSGKVLRSALRRLCFRAAWEQADLALTSRSKPSAAWHTTVGVILIILAMLDAVEDFPVDACGTCVSVEEWECPISVGDQRFQIVSIAAERLWLRRRRCKFTLHSKAENACVFRQIGRPKAYIPQFSNLQHMDLLLDSASSLDQPDPQPAIVTRGSLMTLSLSTTRPDTACEACSA